MAERTAAKKAAPRKAAVPAPNPENGAGTALPPELDGQAALWPEGDPVAMLLGQILTVQGQHLEATHKLVEITGRAAELTQAGTAELVATRREIQTAAGGLAELVTEVRGLVDQLRPYLPVVKQLAERAQQLSTPGGFLKSALLGGAGKGAHRGR